MAADGELTILQINDTHGYLEPHHELVWEAGEVRYVTLGGYARIAALFQAVRRERQGAVVALDNGDTFHGTYPVVRSKGEILLPLLARLGLDGMTGHWDFAYGPAQLRRLVAGLDYPMLAVNCFDRESGRAAFQPWRVVERGGLRVGIAGLAATIVDKGMPPHFSEGLRFSLGRDELPETIRRLREEKGADLVVVLSHLGFPQDMKLASEVAGIDVLLSGHTHNRLEKPAEVNGALVIQSGCHGAFVGRLDVTVRDGRIARFSHRLVPVDDGVAPDPDTAALVEAAMAPHRAVLDEVVGHTETGLNRNTVLEATMDNLLLDAIAAAAGTDLAFSNGWRYGAPVPPGPVTMGDLWNMIPTDPPVSIVELTGTELRAMMEDSLESVFSPDPYRQMGGYVKRCRGVNIYAKLENPHGSRIERYFAEGQPLDAGRAYRAAYVSDQAVPEKYGRNRTEIGVRAVAALRRHLASGSPVSCSLRGSIVAI